MRVLITGGTGSLGTALLAHYLASDVERVCVYSRDEWKQAQLAERFPDPRVRWFLGDVRDVARLEQAMWGCDTVVHAAALKRVDRVAYDPLEVTKTNVRGTENVITAAMRSGGVERVLLISSDKAVEPTNIYGASKMVAEWLMTMGNIYAYPRGVQLASVRYGNVLGSRGSVVQVWRERAAAGAPIEITDRRCTRFWITMPQAVGLIDYALATMEGGEVFVPVLPSMRITDLAAAIAPDADQVDVGLRPGGEKLHEKLLGSEEITRTGQVGKYFVVQPSLRPWTNQRANVARLAPGFTYASDTNSWWLTVDEIRGMLAT